jgi:putative membrane protein
LCGRVYPTVSALLDQHLGGIVVWIPAAMMSVIGFFVVLNHFRLHEEAETRTLVSRGDIPPGAIVLHAARWTGR